MGTVFSAYDIRGRIDDNTLTVETAWTAGNAFADWLQNDGTIVVVKANIVNEDIAHGFIEGILLLGRDVVSGSGDENTVAQLIVDQKAAGGALISHDELQNLEIITLFAENGRVITAESGLNELNLLVESGNFLPAPQKGTLLS